MMYLTALGRFGFAAFTAATLAAAPSVAQAACPGHARDEQQIGPYVAPDITVPDLTAKFDPRGRTIPIPGVDGLFVRHRSGAGLWLSGAPANANVFLKPGRERVSVDLKLDF